jgi:hypothetical protein
MCWWLGEYHEETSEPPFPPALDDELEHDDDVFGVYLAVERAESSPGPDAQKAIADAAAVGYDVDVSSDIDCDRGAREQLGLDPARDYSTVVLYFETRARAQAVRRPFRTRSCRHSRGDALLSRLRGLADDVPLAASDRPYR